MIATKNSCDLDIAVFLAMTKYTKHTGITAMTAEEIYEYTSDIIRLCSSSTHLECPPWRIFQECLLRLVGYGLLLSTQEIKIRNTSLYATRLNHNDIIAALRGGNNSMIHQVFPIENGRS